MLFRGYLGDDQFCASLAARVTYDLIGGAAVPSAEQAWKISPGPWECEYGPMDGDEVLYRGGVDLFVFGHARAPQGGKVTQSEVVIEVGASFRRRIAVFGDRLWRKQGNDLVPDDPRPFSDVPLTPQNAFGGKDQWDELEVPYPENPDGKGFFLEQETAVDKPLPNLEDPDHLIRRWDDRPEPACVTPCAAQNPLRVRNGLEIGDDGSLKELKPEFYNAAFPRMILKQAPPGDTVRLCGMTPAGVLEFHIPPNSLVIWLRIDQQVVEAPLALDQIGVEVDKGRVAITYRFPFRYKFYPMQRRSCELFDLSTRPVAQAGS